MYDGYLSFAGTEIINAARTSAYLKALGPRLQVKCDAAGLNTALGHAAYSTPAADGAPWYKSSRAATGGFYGLIPGRIQGGEDSTREVQLTELTGDGAVMTTSRYASRETRFVATAFAASEEAMEAGLAWLRDKLAADACGASVGLGCKGHQAMRFTSKPVSNAQMQEYQRTFYKTEITEGPKVTERLGFKSVTAWTVEFTMTSGRPWAFTLAKAIATLDLPSGTSWTDPAGEDCSVADDAYDDFINDPYFTAIAKPPRPATILPPNILAIDSWRRRTVSLPADVTGRWGRIVPIVRVQTGGAAAQQVRLRFYRGTTVSGCGYDGEFLVSYLPANSVLLIDGVRQEVSVTKANGQVVPGGHLLYGSAGRPFMWPSMGCQQGYTMTADMMPGQTGVTVSLDTAIRE
ncbi:minor tail protein [Arthrobacter phage SilentRX]|uniref:Minor tail protein n=1 Tax=Arthrobacter phage SilentRX TaxID=2836091 RepID=A0A8F3E8M5_9CAUD|nr:minor tail protein [Arthrobacter phage SilentRX]QWY82772.1 minor tail protein [Arthrobacter phage SilentRX]